MALDFNTTENIISAGDGAGMRLDPGATEVVEISNGVLLPDGTAAEPSIRFSDDTNTGIFSPSNEVIAFVGDGAISLQVAGNTAYVNYVEVNGSGTGQDVVIKAAGADTNIDIDLQPKGTGKVFVGGTEIAKIGDAPTAHNHVKADITDFSDADYAAAVHNHVKADITDFNDADYATSAQGLLAASALQSGANISVLTNDAGFITSYTVTEGDVTAHQAALTITESQISDLGTYAVVGHTHSTADITDLASYTGLDGRYLMDAPSDGTDYVRLNGTWSPLSVPPGSFTDLSDTPPSYTASKFVAVNSGGTALEFVDAPVGGLTGLDDVPGVNVPSPTDGQVLTWVNAAGEWQAADAGGGGGGEDYFTANSTGTLPTATGADAIAIGVSCTAPGFRQVNIGTQKALIASHGRAVAIGDQSTANTNSVGVGPGAEAIGDSSIHIGQNATGGAGCTGIYSIGLGYRIDATGLGSIAIGNTIQNYFEKSFRVGYRTECVLHLKNLGRLHLEGTQAGYVAPGFASGAEPTAVAGQIIYDSTTNKLKFYNGSSWETITSA